MQRHMRIKSTPQTVYLDRIPANIPYLTIKTIEAFVYPLDFNLRFITVSGERRKNNKHKLKLHIMPIKPLFYFIKPSLNLIQSSLYLIKPSLYLIKSCIDRIKPPIYLLKLQLHRHGEILHERGQLRNLALRCGGCRHLCLFLRILTHTKSISRPYREPATACGFSSSPGLNNL